MTSGSALQRFDVARPPDGVPGGLVRFAGDILTALLGLAALTVAARRLAGALDSPLTPPQLLAAGLILAIVASAACIARGYRLESRPRLGLPVRLLTSAALAVLAASVTLRGENPIAAWTFWTILLGEECWAWRRGRIGRTSAATDAAWSQAEPTDSGDDVVLGATASIPDADVLQQLTLSQTDVHGQRLSGWLRLPVAEGQRTGTLHVAFCPPFHTTPQVEVRQVAGPACRIKPAQLLPYGVRLEVKLQAAAIEPDAIVVQFSAQCGQEPARD